MCAGGYDLRISEIGGVAEGLAEWLAEAYWPADGIVLFDTPDAVPCWPSAPPTPRCQW